MEVLKVKYINFKNSYASLRKAIETREKFRNSNDPDLIDVIEAGVIKHFEIAWETSWKFLQALIRSKNIATENSPKKIIRDCYSLGILPKKVAETLEELADVRNETTHVYDQDMSHEVCNEIINHYLILGDIIKHIFENKMLND